MNVWQALACGAPWFAVGYASRYAHPAYLLGLSLFAFLATFAVTVYESESFRLALRAERKLKEGDSR